MTGTDLCVNKSQFVPVIFEPPCITYWSVCACLRVGACVRLGTRVRGACVCAYVHITLVIQHATPMHYIVTSFVAPRSPLHFFDYLINGAIFGKKLLNIKCVFLFSLQPLSKTFLILRRI
jgi:hypothetical protein